MATSSSPRAADLDRQLFILSRWQEYEGEARANTLRIIAIGAFYGVELINYYGLQLGFIELPKVAEDRFHQAITGLAVLWTLAGFGVLACLRQQYFPAILKYLSTACDLVLLTIVLALADGPRSPLLAGYFVILTLAALRLHLPLIRFATVGSIGGYLLLLGYVQWWTDRDLQVPRYHQLIMLLALAMSGLVLGQIIRRVGALVRDLAGRTRVDGGTGV
jgi:hypothetical protein